MMLTEAEAKKKWCPEARVAIGEQVNDGEPIQLIAANRPDDYLVADHCRCIASACMMWRQMWPNSRVPGDLEIGYCGKAGRP